MPCMIRPLRPPSIKRTRGLQQGFPTPLSTLLQLVLRDEYSCREVQTDDFPTASDQSSHGGIKLEARGPANSSSQPWACLLNSEVSFSNLSELYRNMFSTLVSKFVSEAVQANNFGSTSTHIYLQAPSTSVAMSTLSTQIWVSKCHFPNTRNQCSLGKWLILGLWQRK